ncbi:MAG TPA: polynucleotide adenylyltransferase PcnB, partial [Gammaproteobacteria bacterium]|nr:polynucleotide adenylyltransferase PcnB [Gammaproteobacteria bacterium]
QLRLARRNRRSIESAFAHPRFRAAYDFLLLREDAGEQLNGLGQWWTDFQCGDAKHKADMIGAVSQRKKSRRRRTRPKKSGGTE